MGASQDTVSVSVRNNGRVGRARWAIRTFQKKATHGSAEREAQGVPYKDDQPAFTLLLFSPARTLSATQLCFARPSLRSYFLPGPTCLLAEPNANAPLHLTNPIHATARNRSLETQTTERQKNERSHAQSPFSRATTNPHLWPPSCARHSLPQAVIHPRPPPFSHRFRRRQRHRLSLYELAQILHLKRALTFFACFSSFLLAIIDSL